MTSKILSLAVVAATLLLATTTIPPSSADLLHRPQFHVHIINELSKNEVLSVQCNCTGDPPKPINYVKVEVGAEYELVFRKHWLEETRWTCFVSPSPDILRNATFVAYEDSTVHYEHNVYWAVKEDGVYFRFPGASDELDFPWSYLTDYL
ncbi:S-protein homolog 9 [Linum grandiflorum]